MGEKDGLTIAKFTVSMLDQVADLHSKYYGDTPEIKKDLFQKRFFHEYSKEKSFLVVAMDGDKIVGTQTFTYWPYIREGRSFEVVQSGLTLVDDDYRRRGLFVRMLEVGHRIAEESGIDFITGFPHQLSFPGLMKGGWSHIGCPRWFLRVINPVRVLKKKARNENDPVVSFDRQFSLDPEPGWGPEFRRIFSEERFHRENTSSLFDYQYGWRTDKYLFFRDDTKKTGIIIVCKIQKRHGFRELVIGDILTKEDVTYKRVKKALATVIDQAKRMKCIDAVSILLNPKAGPFVSLLCPRLFIPLPKQVIFCVNNILTQLEDACADNYANWNLMFSDIDTW